LVREGLRQVLRELEPGTQILQAGNCAEAFDAAAAHGDIDLVLLDYHLPDMNGLDALAVFGERHPELPVMMLSGTANADLMRQVLQGGAAGFVTKSSLSEDLLQAVRKVLDGDVYIPAELGAAMLTQDSNAGNDKARLTQRQELVLQGLQDGRSNREIADQMHISEETVKSHVAAILRHFNVQNRTQAVVAAGRAGYPTPRR
jgi:DNA-binding NarL/FixJ family response regulator